MAQINEIRDEEKYREYGEKARELVLKHNGEYITVSDRITPMGDWRPLRIVILKFPDKATLGACFSSPEYKAIASLRENSTTGKAVIVED